MSHREEAEIRMHQDEQDAQEEDNFLDEQVIDTLDVSKILDNSEKYKLSDKQKQQLNKVHQLRRKLKLLLDKKSGLSKDMETAFDET